MEIVIGNIYHIIKILHWKLFDNPNKDWDWSNISSNTEITMEFVKNNPNKNWFWISLSENQNIKLEDIYNNINFLHWNYISKNPNLTLEFINNNINKPELGFYF